MSTESGVSNAATHSRPQLSAAPRPGCAAHAPPGRAPAAGQGRLQRAGRAAGPGLRARAPLVMSPCSQPLDLMLPPRLLLAALLGALVALATAALHWARGRHHHRPAAIALSPARAAAVAAAAAHPRRALPTDHHTSVLPNTRDLASFLPGIRPGLLYRTASPLAEGGAGAAALSAPPLNVATLVDLRSRAEWEGGESTAAATTLSASLHRLPTRPDRPGRDAAVALAGHWQRAWRRRGGAWHPPPADPPLRVGAAVAGPGLTIIHAPVQAWGPYLRTFVLGHAPPPEGVAVLAAFTAARAAGLRPPIPAVRARVEAATAAAGLAGMYCALLDAFGPELVGAVAAVAGALRGSTPSPPVAVACKLGKDRTGLVCALVGLAAGAPEAAVLADFAASEGRSDTPPLPAGLAQALGGAPAAALAAALDHLDAAHGGWRAYLAAHGFGPDAQAALAVALREGR